LPDDLLELRYKDNNIEKTIKINFLSKEENTYFVNCNKKNSIVKEKVVYNKIPEKQEKENINTTFTGSKNIFTNEEKVDEVIE